MTKIALVQSDITWNDPDTSIEHLAPLVSSAHDQGADIIVLPEMFACGFSFPEGHSARRTSQLGQEAMLDWSGKYQAAIVGSLPSLGTLETKPRNTLLVADRGKIVGSYHKVHLFSFAKEDERYSRGDDPLVLRLAGLRCGFFVCYDLRFPEMWNALAEHCDAFVVVANWPHRRASHWRALLQARAIDNQAFVIGVNRVGIGGDLVYSGGSVAVSPTGEFIEELGSKVQVSVIDVDASASVEYRTSFPTLKDRRPDVYQRIRERGVV